MLILYEEWRWLYHKISVITDSRFPYSQRNVLTGHHCVHEIIWSVISWYLYHLSFQKKHGGAYLFFLCILEWRYNCHFPFKTSLMNHLTTYIVQSSVLGVTLHVLGWRAQPCVSSLQSDIGCPVVLAAAIPDAMLLPTEGQYLKWKCITANTDLVILWLNVN
jgi:hypothetical protein